MKTIIGTLLLIALISISISSANSPPSNPTTLAGPITGISRTTYAYSTSATDPDGGQINITIEWGDGSKNTTSGASGATVTASHAWIVPAGSSKTFSLRAKATDADGLEANCWSGMLAVNISGPELPPNPTNAPPGMPSIPVGDEIGKSGSIYSYSTKAIDPNGDKVKYTFDWGDGKTSTTSLVASGTSATASYSWTIPAGTKKTFNVRAKATDEHGAVSEWCVPLPVLIITPIINHPPTIPIKASGPASGLSGKSYSFSTSSTDADGDPIRYTFSWGDGLTQTGFFPAGQVVTASHTWNVPAGKTWSYSVRALATDHHSMMSPDPMWSDPLVVSIKGPDVG